MNSREDRSSALWSHPDTPAPWYQRAWIRLRGCFPLGMVGIGIFALPTLLAWLVIGGSFSWRHLAIGLVVGIGLLIGGGLALGWAFGRIKRGKRRP